MMVLQLTRSHATGRTGNRLVGNLLRAKAKNGKHHAIRPSLEKAGSVGCYTEFVGVEVRSVRQVPLIETRQKANDSKHTNDS